MNDPKPTETVAHLIAQYGPQRSGPGAKLRPHAEFIGELRSNHASYDTIVAILRERHGLEISDTTLRKFCREVLKEPPPKRRDNRPAQSAPAVITQPLSPRPAPPPRTGGPQVAQVEFIEELKPMT